MTRPDTSLSVAHDSSSHSVYVGYQYAFIFQGDRVLRLKDAKPRNLMETNGTIGAMTQPQGAPWVVFWVHLGPCKIACFKTMLY